MKRAIIFDFDNTLEEWLPFEEEVERQCSRELSDKYGIPAEEFQRAFDTIKVSYLRQRAIPQDYGRDVWFSEALAHFKVYDVDIKPLVEHYWELLTARVRLFPGTKELLDRLRPRFRLGLLSDGDGKERHWKEARIKRVGLDGAFHAVVTSNDIGANKPHPRCFIETARQLGVRPEECFMVGDNPPIDLAMAKELGMETVWQRQGLFGAAHDASYPYIDHIVDDILEVESLVLAPPAQIRD